MRGKGIHYDTGTSPNGETSRPAFDPRVVEREMQIIADDLHCTAVRVTGGDPERLSVAAECAAAADLEVWYSPFPCEVTNEQMLPYFADCAERAERLRGDGADVVLVTGCELSLFAAGYLPGDTFSARIPVLASPGREAAFKPIPDKVNAFLDEIVRTVRPIFGGAITYASAPLDGVDWSPFDIVGLDAYRGLRNATTFRDDLRRDLAHGKPVAITEVGCCTFRGAGDFGGAGWYVAVEPDGAAIKLGLVRDEGEQVRYLHDLMPVFEEEGIDTVFWFSFAGYSTPHRADARADMDMASYGIVKLLDADGAPPTPARTYPGMPWEPKEAFHALAAYYGGLGQ